MSAFGTKRNFNAVDEDEENEEELDNLYLSAYTGKLEYENTNSIEEESVLSLSSNQVNDSEEEEEKEQETQSEENKGGQRRYYDPEDLSIKCFNCDGVGHMSFQCIEEKKERPCFLCGEMGHRKSDCPHDLCFNCQQSGHKSNECPSPKKYTTRETCYRCGTLGHVVKDCDQEYRPNLHLRSPNLFCYNCGRKGHAGRDCREPRLESLDSKRIKMGDSYNNNKGGSWKSLSQHKSM